jgi:hypothetical protein
MAEDVSSRVVELTGRSRENFDVVVDRGQASRALCEQSARVSADLVVVMADRLLEGEAATVTRDLVRGCNCSVLVLGTAAGEAERTPERVAVVALEGEVEFVPELVSAALFVSSKRPPGIDVVLWVAERDVEASAITAQLARQSSDLGMPLAPWFADVRDTTMLMARASRHPSIGLLVILAPPPAELAKSASGPIDDILPEATSSILLLRLGWPVI